MLELIEVSIGVVILTCLKFCHFCIEGKVVVVVNLLMSLQMISKECYTTVVFQMYLDNTLDTFI